MNLSHWRRTCFEILFFITLFVFLNSHLVHSESSDPFEINNEGIKAAEAGDFDMAVSKLKRAYQIKSDSQIAHNLSKILSDWATKLYNQNKAEQAIQKLEQAVKYDSTNGPAWYFLGDIAYLKKSNFESALKSWKKALETAPENIRPSIVERIAKAETDQKLERNFLSKDSQHFVARFSESVQSASVESVLSILEAEYQKLSDELKIEPSKLTVIIYPKSSFDRLSSRFDWAIGFYDGRIRIREDDLGSGLESTILPHELAHAFLQHGFGAAIPTWIHEGYAQTREPIRELSAEDQEILNGIKNRTKWIPLEWIDKRFAQPVDSSDVSRAYLEAGFAVTYLMKRFSREHFRQFLMSISQGKAIPDSFDVIFKPVKWSAFSQGSIEAST